MSYETDRAEAFKRMREKLREDPLNFQNYPNGTKGESEEKSMLHNVTVKHEEKRCLNSIW